MYEIGGQTKAEKKFSYLFAMVQRPKNVVDN
jgi:hypothetical protein